MGNGHRGRAHFGHDFPDQLVDHPGHDRIQPGRRFVKEDDLGFRRDGAGQADALLHAARKLGRVKLGHIGRQADAAQFFNGNLAGLGLGALLRSAQQAESHVFPHAHRIKQRTTLEQHAKPSKESVALDLRHVLTIQRDRAAVRVDKPKDTFQQHRFPGARSADDDHGLARRDVQGHTPQHRVAAKAFGDILQGDHEVKNSSVRR